MEFVGKTVWITGASQGIGRGLALHFAKRGAKLAILARNLEGLTETAALATSLGARCFHAQADLRVKEDVVSFVSAAVDQGFPPDVIIHNAADTTSKPFLETSLDEIESIVQTNITGVLLLSRQAAPHMAHAGNGIMVYLSSLAGYKPNPMQTVYSISKGGLNSVSSGLGADLRAYGIHTINVALMGIGDGPGQYSLDALALRLERAMDRREHEVFLYRSSGFLMRLYGAFPGLARWRSPRT
ncbi:MAG: hypothetical protein AMXMBFR84_45380 [Candidatus Hydrogenedentota bacterium]